jgi:hypothetical protein
VLARGADRLRRQVAAAEPRRQHRRVMHRAGDSTTINGFGKLNATIFAL